jgi:hypothetical protein
MQDDWKRERELTKDEDYLRAQISSLTITIDRFQRRLWTIKNSCKHTLLEVNMFHDDVGIVRCAICGHDFGWWCPKSPDHYCHYDKGNEDSCDYCGQPEERK